MSNFAASSASREKKTVPIIVMPGEKYSDKLMATRIMMISMAMAAINSIIR